MRTDSKRRALALRRRISFWGKRLGVAPTSVMLVDMKSKWASCSARGRLTLSREVLGLPPRLREYVILHELLHLRIRNHGRLYKAQMRVFMPDWQLRHQALSRRVCPPTNDEHRNLS